MKKHYFLVLFIFIFFWTSLAAQSSAAQHSSSSGLEISFVFNRQGGFSSNQFAIWIEDSRGNYVKTLYATKFTAAGGFEKRPQSIPLWVQKSGLAGLSKQDIDALSGATPRKGKLSFSWDGLDKNRKAVPAGEYRVFLEATLRGDNRVLYSADFLLGSGSPVNVNIKTEYFGSSTKERDMIGDVKVITK